MRPRTGRALTAFSAGRPSSRSPRPMWPCFVGTEFDVLKGRGGPGRPPTSRSARRPGARSPGNWAAKSRLAVVAEHDAKGIAPAGDVIRQMLPTGPVLILMDELLHYMSTGPKARPGRPALQLPPQPGRGGPRAEQRGAVRLDPVVERRRDEPRRPPRLRGDQADARPAGQGDHDVGRQGNGRDHPPPVVRVARDCRRRPQDGVGLLPNGPSNMPRN